MLQSDQISDLQSALLGGFVFSDTLGTAIGSNDASNKMTKTYSVVKRNVTNQNVKKSPKYIILKHYLQDGL